MSRALPVRASSTFATPPARFCRRATADALRKWLGRMDEKISRKTRQEQKNHCYAKTYYNTDTVNLMVSLYHGAVLWWYYCTHSSLAHDVLVFPHPKAASCSVSYRRQQHGARNALPEFTTSPRTCTLRERHPRSTSHGRCTKPSLQTDRQRDDARVRKRRGGGSESKQASR